MFQQAYNNLSVIYVMFVVQCPSSIQTFKTHAQLHRIQTKLLKTKCLWLILYSRWKLKCGKWLKNRFFTCKHYSTSVIDWPVLQNYRCQWWTAAWSCRRQKFPAHLRICLFLELSSVVLNCPPFSLPRSTLLMSRQNTCRDEVVVIYLTKIMPKLKLARNQIILAEFIPRWN